MSLIKIGIVSEGKSDQIVLKKFIEEYFTNIENLGHTLAFVDLQPSPDVTSSGSPNGGWEMVYKWCQRNPPQDRKNQILGAAMFANDLDNFQCDIILVQMDSDIYLKIGDKTNITPVPSLTDTSLAKGAFVRSVLQEWLWPENSEQDKKHVTAVSVESIESWLAAGICPETSIDYEAHEDIGKYLAILDHKYIKEVDVPKDIKRPKKTADNYKKLSDKAVKNITKVINRCEHFNIAMTELSSAIVALYGN